MRLIRSLGKIGNIYIERERYIIFLFCAWKCSEHVKHTQIHKYIKFTEIVDVSHMEPMEPMLKEMHEQLWRR